MNAQNLWRLQRNHLNLVKDIDTWEVTNLLYQENVLSDHQKERIERKETTVDKNERLLEFIRQKGEVAYQKLHTALSITTPHLAKMLDDTPLEDSTPGKEETNSQRTEEFKLKMVSMTQSQVKDWLIHTCELDESDAQDFELLDFDGHAMEELMSTDVKDYESLMPGYFPKLRPGTRLKIRSKWKSCQCTTAIPQAAPKKQTRSGSVELESTAAPKQEQRVSETPSGTKYKTNDVFKSPEELSLIHHVHKFIPCRKSDDMLNATSISEAVSTIAGSLNSYQNVTLHFGMKTNKDGNGVIEGFPTSFSSLGELKHRILQHFLDDQRDTIDSLMSEPYLVDVHGGNCDLKVVEMTVEAQSDVEEVFVTLPKYSGLLFFALVDKVAEKLEGANQKQFLKFRSVLRAARSDAEKGSDSKPASFYLEHFEKLSDLLTLGNGTINDGLFPILISGSLPSDLGEDVILERFSFVSDIDWKAVFDFDPESKICSALEDRNEPITLRKLDEVGPRKFEEVGSKDDDKVLTHSTKPWILMNGHKGVGNITDLVSWRTSNTGSLRKLVTTLKNEVPTDRAVIVFCLMSEKFSTMLDMFSEIDREFPNQWCVLSEDEHLLNVWNTEIVKRTYKDENDESLHENSIVGLPWHIISKQMKLLTKPKVSVDCNIPSSKGIIKLSEKNDLTSLEVVGVDTCELELKTLAEERDIGELKKEEEERFFRGGKVSWKNFAFEGQVCERSVHTNLRRAIVNALEGKGSQYVNGDCVGVIDLYHQPGAGGTTTSRHVLWDLRKQYRCAVVKEIVSLQTSKQVFNFRKFGEDDESKRRPVLLLVDGGDPEKIRSLRLEMEFEAKRAKIEARNEETENLEADNLEKFSVVVLICRRQTVSTSDDNLALSHRLNTKEVDWFVRKYKELEKKHKKKRGSDPEMLFSFNVMKTNFDRTAIRKVVRDLVSKMSTDEERKALKYLSILNCFDQEFRAIPTAVFDSLMNKGAPTALTFTFGIMHMRRQRKMGTRPPKSQWEMNTSETWKLLVIDSTDQHISYHNGLTICNRILAEEIRDFFVEHQKPVQTVSQIMSELLDRKEFFATDGNSSHIKSLQLIVRDVLKKRVLDEETEQKSKFSPLVEYVGSSESHMKAAALLEQGYKVFNQDPFIAQQIARFYLYSNYNYRSALKYAEEGLKKKSESSYFHDTHGQVYKMHFVKESSEVLNNGGNASLDPRSSTGVIEIALQAVTAFQNAQTWSKQEYFHGLINMSGYVGELETTLKLLKFMGAVKGLTERDDFHRFLVHPDFCPKPLLPWKSVNGQDLVARLKLLGTTVEQTLHDVEDLDSQLREAYLDDNQMKQKILCQNEIVKYKEALKFYFGEQSDHIPKSLDEMGKCEYRRRRAIRLCGNSFSFSSMAKIKEAKQIQSISKLISCNLESDGRSSKDLMIVLGTKLLLATMWRIKDFDVPFHQMVEWSHRLYEERATLSSSLIYLEPYLFYVMLNWPSCDRKENKRQQIPSPLNEVIRQWKLEYARKFPFLRKEESFSSGIKQKNVFFLAKGTEMQRYKCTDSGFDYNGKNFWNSEVVRKKLHQFEGVITDNLGVVELRFSDWKDETLKITSAVPAPYYTWRHNKVYFYIGFTWSGPVAYGLSKKPAPLEDGIRETLATVTPETHACETECSSPATRSLTDETSSSACTPPEDFKLVKPKRKKSGKKKK